MVTEWFALIVFCKRYCGRIYEFFKGEVLQLGYENNNSVF